MPSLHLTVPGVAFVKSLQIMGARLPAQQLRPHASRAGAVGSIPGRGTTEIPRAMWPRKKDSINNKCAEKSIFCTAGGNVNWCSRCGERCGVSSENEKETRHTIQQPHQDEGSLVAQAAKNTPTAPHSWVGTLPCRRQRLPTPLWLENSMDRAAWWVQSH